MPERGLDVYRRDLALVYHRGFAAHALASAPGMLTLLEPVLARSGLVVEIGCGSGLLTRELVNAGHRVIATDASPAMLELASEYAPGAVGFQRLTLPDDPLPRADAVVSVGHVITYLPDDRAVDRALVAIARALRPGGILAIDLVDAQYAQARRKAAHLGRAGDDWACIDEFSSPAPNRFVRQLTTFLPNGDGSWRRDTEHHQHLLIAAEHLPDVLAAEGVHARVEEAFGSEPLPPGLRVLIGQRPAPAPAHREAADGA
jgi:SAM-dependent methyltransferase